MGKKHTESGKNLQRKTVHELNVNTILAYPVCITHPNTYSNSAPTHTQWSDQIEWKEGKETATRSNEGHPIFVAFAFGSTVIDHYSSFLFFLLHFDTRNSLKMRPGALSWYRAQRNATKPAFHTHSIAIPFISVLRYFVRFSLYRKNAF